MNERKDDEGQRGAERFKEGAEPSLCRERRRSSTSEPFFILEQKVDFFPLSVYFFIFFWLSMMNTDSGFFPTFCDEKRGEIFFALNDED